MHLKSLRDGIIAITSCSYAQNSKCFVLLLNSYKTSNFPTAPPGVWVPRGCTCKTFHAKLRRFVRYRISAPSLCTFASRTLPRRRPSGADTLMMPSPSTSKCLYPQSLLGKGNTNALRLNVYFPCPLLWIEALTRTRLGINRVSAADGRHRGSVQLANERKSKKSRNIHEEMTRNQNWRKK